MTTGAPSPAGREKASRGNPTDEGGAAAHVLPDRQGPHPPSADAEATLSRSTGEGSARILTFFVIIAGLSTALLFIVVGLAFELQTYGDGAIFSYAVAVEDVWAFHWRDIAVRATVWLTQLLPGEFVVAITGKAAAGILVYGFLSFFAQAWGLGATFLFDRTPRKTFFLFACVSTACLCPLAFGFPTEMLLAHALIWPTFALAFCAHRTKRAAALLFAFMLALVFTHEAALGLAFGVVVATALRGFGHPTFWRAALCFGAVAAIWLAINAGFPPEPYYAEVRLRAASEFLDRRTFASSVVVLIAAALAGYGALNVLLRHALVRHCRPAEIASGDFACAPRNESVVSLAPIIAAALVVVALVLWWTLFDHALHAENRYYARTILLIGTCAFATLCGLLVLRQEGRAVARSAPIARSLDALTNRRLPRALIGALAIVLLVHGVETVKFLRAWTDYRAAVRALATGQAADPELGAPFFVSSQRIGADLNRLSWFSTTPYFSADVADFRPTRLVIDPAGNYFWISCALATASAAKASAVPAQTREMIRVYACANRR